MTDPADLAPADESIRLQAHEGPLIREWEHVSLEQVVLHLMHERAYVEAATYAAGKTLLDVGCNTGYGTLRLASVAARAVGVDVSRAALEEARSRPGADAVEFRLVDGRTLPFADDAFDVITSFQVIEHLLEPGPFVAEIHRVLAPGGVALLTTPNARFRLEPGMRPWNRFHVREFTPHQLETLLRTVFDSVSLRGMVAIPELLEIEWARVQRSLRHAKVARRAARADRSRSRTSSLLTRSRVLLVRPAAAVVRALWRLPEALAVRLAPGTSQDRVPLGDRATERPATGLAGFTTGDLSYRSEDLDATMDLLAVCTKARTR